MERKAQAAPAKRRSLALPLRSALPGWLRRHPRLAAAAVSLVVALALAAVAVPRLLHGPLVEMVRPCGAVASRVTRQFVRSSTFGCFSASASAVLSASILPSLQFGCASQGVFALASQRSISTPSGRE